MDLLHPLSVLEQLAERLAHTRAHRRLDMLIAARKRREELEEEPVMIEQGDANGKEEELIAALCAELEEEEEEETAPAAIAKTAAEEKWETVSAGEGDEAWELRKDGDVSEGEGDEDEGIAMKNRVGAMAYSWSAAMLTSHQKRDLETQHARGV